MKVRDCMSRPARTLSPDTPVRKILRMMVETGITGFPVVNEEGELLGFVPESALMARVIEPQEEQTWNVRAYIEQQRRLYGSTAGEIMQMDPITIEDSADLTEAIELMLRERVSRLPVTRRGKVVGYLSRTDLLKAVLELEERRSHQLAAPTDDEIHRRAQQLIQSYLGAVALSIRLKVSGGHLSLTGTIDDHRASQELETLLGELPGVKSVANQLLIDQLLD